jgi:hypothetical protein
MEAKSKMRFIDQAPSNHPQKTEIDLLLMIQPH